MGPYQLSPKSILQVCCQCSLHFANSRSLSLSHTLSRSLTHTHTHTSYLSFSLSLFKNTLPQSQAHAPSHYNNNVPVLLFLLSFSP